MDYFAAKAKLVTKLPTSAMGHKLGCKGSVQVVRLRVLGKIYLLFGPLWVFGGPVFDEATPPPHPPFIAVLGPFMSQGKDSIHFRLHRCE